MSQVTIFTRARSWLGLGRIFPHIQERGFSITLVAPQGSLLSRSSCIDHLISISPEQNDQAWEDALLSSGGGKLLIGDDFAIDWVLQQSASNRQLEQLLETALGKLPNLRVARNKFQLSQLAAKLGIPVPETISIGHWIDAGHLRSHLNWPIVLKGAHGHAGNDVFICHSYRDIRRARKILGQQERVFAQKYIEGTSLMVNVACQRGAVLSKLTARKQACWPTEVGPSTVVDIETEPKVEAYVETLVARLGLSGLLSFDFVQDARSNFWLLECNLRPAPICHVGGNLVNAWLSNNATQLSVGDISRLALYPQSLLAPVPTDIFQSAKLDKPTNDRGLLDAMAELIDTARTS